MVKVDNLSKAFEALGEKIANLELELSCKAFLLERAEKELEELRKMMGSTATDAPKNEEW